MTDRVRTLKVLLSRDTRVDDVEVVKNAISMIRGVQKVEDGDVVGLDEHLARDAALRDFIIMQMEFLGLALTGGAGREEKYKQVRDILSASYREKTGRSLF